MITSGGYPFLFFGGFFNNLLGSCYRLRGWLNHTVGRQLLVQDCQVTTI